MQGSHDIWDAQGQTRQHARLVNLLGVKQICVGLSLQVHKWHIPTKGVETPEISGCRKRGVEFKGGSHSLHDGFGGFDGFGGSENHLALFLLVLRSTVPRGSRDGFGGQL